MSKPKLLHPPILHLLLQLHRSQIIAPYCQVLWQIIWQGCSMLTLPLGKVENCNKKALTMTTNLLVYAVEHWGIHEKLQQWCHVEIITQKKKRWGRIGNTEKTVLQSEIRHRGGRRQKREQGRKSSNCSSGTGESSSVSTASGSLVVSRRFWWAWHFTRRLI